MTDLKPPQYPNNLAATYLLHVIEDRHAAKRALDHGRRNRGVTNFNWADQARAHLRSSWKWMRKYQALVHKDVYYQGWGDNLVEVPLPQPEPADAT